MSSHQEQVLALVIDKIRATVNEDWIADFDIGLETRFNDDLELESIEFVKIADALQAHYGNQLAIIAWLSGKSIHELIGLSVGDLVDYIAATLAPAQAE
ncbi:MAG: acyl carrier protein [Nevskiaceae bacterium]|nr:MAG: acyl carrier protein [Nevskiaceae bacterium]TAM22323.1 MAG: acyl carrier protein [Nevskiaceae bacterium]